MARMVSFAVLLIFIALIGFMFYRVMSTFLLPMFLAALLVVIFHPLHHWILKKTGERHRVSAVITTVAVLMIVLLPTLWVMSFAVIEGVSLVGQSDVATLTKKISNLRNSFGLEMPYPNELRSIEKLMESVSDEKNTTKVGPSVLHSIAEQSESLHRKLQKSGEDFPSASMDEYLAALKEINLTESDFVKRESAIQVAMREFREFKVQLLGGSFKAWACELANPSPEEIRSLTKMALNWTKSQLLSLTGATGKFLGQLTIGLIIMTVTLYFFLVDGPSMLQTVQRLSPLDDRYETELLLEFDKISRAVVLATLLSAIAQGVLAGIGFAVAGVGSVFLLTLMTTVLALVPFVGAAAVWVPCCLWLAFSEGRVVAGVLLAIYGAGVVSTIDNVIKPLVLHGQSRLHPLLALLSVLGGVQALGPIGILVGPMVVVFLQTLLNILQRELSEHDEAEAPSLAVEGGGAVSAETDTEVDDDQEDGQDVDEPSDNED